MRFLKNASLCARDPINIYRRLSSEERLIKDTVSAYANQELRHRIKEDYILGRYDRSVIKELGNLGLLGMTSLDEPASYLSYGLACNILEGVDSAYRSTMSVQSSLVIYPIVKYGNKEIKKKYLEKLRSGELLGCFGLTEANAGSDPSSMRTRAIIDGDNYILNGNKIWITNSPYADVFVIWAKVYNEKVDGMRIGGFILDRSMDGIKTKEIENKLSMRASSTGEIVLNDVKVPKSNKLKIEGLRGPLSCLNQARFGVAWGALGAASDCIVEAMEYGDNRMIFKKSLLEYQAPQIKLANSISRVASGMALGYYNAVEREENNDIAAITSILKRENCSIALDTALVCRDILGANGVTGDYSPLRHALNMQSVITYEGTSDIHGLIIGKELTGANAFK